MLTQAEIDALLAGTIDVEGTDSDGRVNLADIISNDPEHEDNKDQLKQVQAYNFWSPDRFSKDQMRAIELVHEDLAERLTSSLPSFLRTNLRPRVVHTEQGRFHDFLNDLTDTTLFHILTLAPLPGQMVLTISSDISYVILEQRLGGRSESDLKARALTEIDQFLLRGMIEHMLNDIKATWSNVITVEPGLEDSTVNQHWVQMLMGNERVMLIIFELAMQDIVGTMNIYIPFSMLKPVSNLLNPHVWITGRRDKQDETAARQKTLKGLYSVSMPVRVFLGNAKVTLRELSELQPGDILPLETSIYDDLPIQVAGQHCFKARIGRAGNRLAAQITSVSTPDEKLSLDDLLLGNK